MSVQIGSLAVSFVAARLLAPADFALVRVSEQIISTLTIAASLGIPTAVMRAGARSPPEAAPAVLGTALALTVASSIFVMLLARPVAAWWADEVVAGVVALVAPTLLITSISRVLIAFQQARLDLRSSAISSATPALLAPPVTACLAVEWGLIGWAAARMITDLSGAVMAWRRTPIAWSELSLRVRDAREVLHFSVGAFLALMTGRIVASLDVLLLARMQVDRDVIASYSMCTLAASTALLVPAALNIVAANRVARLHATAEVMLHGELLRSVAANVIAAAPPLLCFALVGPIVLPALLGDSYRVSRVMAALVASGWLVECASSALGTFLFSIGRPWTSAIANAVAITCGFLLGSLLTMDAAEFGGAQLFLCVAVSRFIALLVGALGALHSESSTET